VNVPERPRQRPRDGQSQRPQNVPPPEGGTFGTGTFVRDTHQKKRAGDVQRQFPKAVTTAPRRATDDHSNPHAHT
jgi:hypothetical protein